MAEPTAATRPVSPETTPDTEKVPHESARKRRGLKKAKMELSLTSMIDVIFNLLIYFVVTANFIQKEGMLLAQLPGIANVESQPTPPITPPVQVDLMEFDQYRVQIYLNKRPLNDTFTELAAQLKGLQANGTYQADHPVEIRAQNHVRWTHVLNAYNQAKAAGYQKVQLKDLDQS